MLAVEKQIDIIRNKNYQVCQHLNTLTPKKVKEHKTHMVSIPIWKEPDQNLLSIEMRQCLESIKDQQIPVILSKEKIVDLVKMPHLLVAGQTGSGKSVFLNAFIVSTIFKTNPSVCKLVLIDPKRVEFSMFKTIPHLWKPVATQLDKITEVLDDLIIEMEKRYDKLEEIGARNLESYNQQTKEKLPYIVVVIDELADLMMVSSHSVEQQITRLVQLARAIGIHIIMATQRPVVEIMTGLIKANMPSRIAFKVASKQDSRVILDQNGAELLKGAGEMLFMQCGIIEKHQGVYVDENQIYSIVNGKQKEIKNESN
jgi:S-DNA-T family DNA segregation ATPase FtsK/SpoIIIE